MENQSGLGKGLSAILPITKTNYVGEKGEKVLKVPVEKIEPNPFQPRKHFADNQLSELTESIKEHGIIQPLIVTAKEGGTYELIAGERRWRAAKSLNLRTVPVIVRQAEKQEKMELALIENLQREDLNSIERAWAYRRLLDEFNLTQEALAKRVGKGRPSITNSLRLLVLPEEIQKALEENKITEGHAKIIMGLDDPAKQLEFFHKIVRHQMTVRDATKILRTIQVKGHTRELKDWQLALREKEKVLEESLGTKVQVQKRGPKGQIVIEFYSDEELDEIMRKICSS